ncbi:MAG TPA: hypothetical protein VHV55_16445 [Pirellulales bacterium]|nr:hypothetical protein [Pirellulales bacterium]
MNDLTSLTITGFKISSDRLSLSWAYRSVAVARSFQFPILSANVLRGGQGVAVAESIDESALRNAVVLNGDGTERFRVFSPIPENQVQGFCDFYYVGNELTAILITPGRDFAVVVDEINGGCLRYYETR